MTKVCVDTYCVQNDVTICQFHDIINRPTTNLCLSASKTHTVHLIITQ